MESILDSSITIPARVKIGPHIYTVRMDNGITSRENFGEMYARILELVIDQHMHISRKESTFLHEVLEAVDFHWKVGLKHNQIELLEMALYQFIQDNPEVFDGRADRGQDSAPRDQ